jgi:DNA (cytosine-5)-methyltransferase 1
MGPGRPRLLDLFSGAGGAAMGYHLAGWDVVGVDATFQVRYPFPFVQDDALDFLGKHGHLFHAVHASPPCQPYSITRHSHNQDHPDLVAATRQALEASGLPWIMENVEGAPLRNPLTLCGTEFGLTATDDDGARLFLRRHRLFESSHLLMAAGGCQCSVYRRRGYRCAGSYGGGSTAQAGSRVGSAAATPGARNRGGYVPAVEVQRALMGVAWMPRKSLVQAIPPAYTEWLGGQLIERLADG